MSAGDGKRSVSAPPLCCAAQYPEQPRSIRFNTMVSTIDATMLNMHPLVRTFIGIRLLLA
jgi:hypothetical protein